MEARTVLLGTPLPQDCPRTQIPGVPAVQRALGQGPFSGWAAGILGLLARNRGCRQQAQQGGQAVTSRSGGTPERCVHLCAHLCAQNAPSRPQGRPLSKVGVQRGCWSSGAQLGLQVQGVQGAPEERVGMGCPADISRSSILVILAEAESQESRSGDALALGGLVRAGEAAAAPGAPAPHQWVPSARLCSSVQPRNPPEALPAPPWPRGPTCFQLSGEM